MQPRPQRLAKAPAAPAEGGDAAAEAPAEPFRIAIVMPNTITDLAWSQSMYDGLLAVQEEMGGENAMEIAYSENMFNVADAAAAIRDYAAEGFDLVIAHGTQYGNSMFEVATDFPETAFAWGTAVDTGADEGHENIFAYEANAGRRLRQRRHRRAAQPVGRHRRGRAGGSGRRQALHRRLRQRRGSHQPGHRGEHLLHRLVQRHGAGGGSGQHPHRREQTSSPGRLQRGGGAIGVAKEAGVPWLGTQSDQSSLAPDLVVANQVYDWNGVLTDMIAKIQAGELGGTAYVLTLENGGLKVVFNDGYATPDDVKTAAEEAIQGVIDGSITTLSE
ncbi:MAG: BMP family ABC transporter substrate-binding protein [Caldilineaceae bacterium]